MLLVKILLKIRKHEKINFFLNRFPHDFFC